MTKHFLTALHPLSIAHGSLGDTQNPDHSTQNCLLASLTPPPLLFIVHPSWPPESSHLIVTSANMLSTTGSFRVQSDQIGSLWPCHSSQLSVDWIYRINVSTTVIYNCYSSPELRRSFTVVIFKSLTCFIWCEWAFCLHVSKHTVCMPGACGGQKRAPDPLQLEL